MKDEKKPIKVKPIKGERIVQVPLNKIEVPDERITSVTPPEIMRELRDSIKEHGILQPLQLIQTDKQLILIDGLHRLKVAHEEGMPTVPCIIRKGTDEVQLVQNVILNRQRGKSDPVGEGVVLRALVRDHKMTVGEACRAVKISHSWGKKLYEIVVLGPAILEMISQGHLSAGSAVHLTALDDPAKQLEVAKDAVNWNYTVEQTKHRVLELLNPDHDKPVGSYEFTEAGQPQQILPVCFSCQTDIHDRLKYAYFHIECFEELQKAMATTNQKEQVELFKPELLPQMIQQQQPMPYPVEPPQPPQPVYQQPTGTNIQQPVYQPPSPQQQQPGINMQQLQCAHKFQQVDSRTIRCDLCGLSVTY